MSLNRSFERTGNFLFRYRGQFPLLLFVCSIPFIFRASENYAQSPLSLPWLMAAIVLCFAGFAVRGYAIGTTPRGTSGRNTSHQVAETVNTSGIYSVVRHPLYLGNYLIWLGLAVFTYDWMFMLLFSLIFWIYYERIMFAEERFLEAKFGAAYLDWAANVPPFIPRFALLKKPLVRFSMVTVLRREYSGLLASLLSLVFTDFVRMTYINGKPALNRELWIPCACIGIFCILLRTLKHHTSLLNEEGRN